MGVRTIITLVCAGIAAGVLFAAGMPGAGDCAPALQADTAAAAGIVVDRVVAMVEDRAILESDVENELKRFLLQTQRTSLPADEEKNVRAEILNGLIADALMSIEAQKENIKIEDKDVDAAVERTIEDNKTTLGGDDAFNAQLAAEGLTLEGLRSIYRDKLRNRMLIERLMYQKVMDDVTVTEGEVADYYKEHLSELPQRPATVSIAAILIEAKPSPDVLKKAFEKITMIEQKLKEGEDFAALAKEYSDCPSAKFGGSLGLVKLEDLNNPEFEEAARKLAVGQVSPPVLTEFGYHLIKVDGIEGDQVKLRHILVRAEPTPADIEKAKKLAEQARDELLAGADFAEAAAKYSDDEATKNAGGLLGEAPVDQLPEELKTAIKGVPDGGIAPLVKEPKGLRIIKVVSWSEGRPYTYDEARSELRRVLEQQKTQEQLAAYVEKLKKKYSVEIKGD
jgi:peptidyl-prolyl cis-trans isomerase SurA